MAISEDLILDALSNVIDPELGKDIITLGMVRNLVIEGKDVSFEVHLTTGACPMKDQIQRACINAVRHLVDPEAHVRINMKSPDKNGTPGGEERKILKGVKNIIAVASGKGGVGKSTIAVNLALSLGKMGASVGLVDTDIYGPSIPTMFNLHEKPNITAQRKIIPLVKYGVQLLSMGFIVNPEEAVVWRGPMVSSAVKQFLGEAEWGELDYLVLDLPPGTGDIQLTIVQTVPLTGAVVVSTPQDVALDDARKAVAMFRKVNVPVLGIVENMAYFTPPDMPEKKYYIFGQNGAKRLSGELEIPFLGEIPLEQSVREGSDSGVPIVIQDESAPSSVAFSQMAKMAVQQTSIRNATLAPTEKIEITRTRW